MSAIKQKVNSTLYEPTLTQQEADYFFDKMMSNWWQRMELTKFIIPWRQKNLLPSGMTKITADYVTDVRSYLAIPSAIFYLAGVFLPIWQLQLLCTFAFNVTMGASQRGDGWDGMIARGFREATKAGGYRDRIRDKQVNLPFMTMQAIIDLYFFVEVFRLVPYHLLPMALVIVIDTVAQLVSLHHLKIEKYFYHLYDIGDNKAKFSGKLKTTLQYIMIEIESLFHAMLPLSLIIPAINVTESLRWLSLVYAGIYLVTSVAALTSLIGHLKTIRKKHQALA